MTLPEIPVAGGTAAIEPSLDYIVAKFPRFPFDKFQSVPNVLGMQMKATGEVMGIGATLEECLLKSVRSLETGVCHFRLAKFDDVPAEELLTYLAEFHRRQHLRRRGAAAPGRESVERIHAVTAIDRAVPRVKLQRTSYAHGAGALPPRRSDAGRAARGEDHGLFRPLRSRSCGTSRSWTSTILRKSRGITPVFRMVDTLRTPSSTYIAYLLLFL